jgi:hypothetical protein
MPSEWKAEEWKAEFDLTMEQIFRDIAETRRTMDEVEIVRGKPRPQLRLVRNDDEGVDRDA